MVAVAGGADLRGDLLETGVSSAILRGLISTHQMAVRQPQRVSCVLTDTRGAWPANGHGAPHGARALGQRRVRAAGGLPRRPSSGSSFGCRKHLDGGPLNRLLSGSASGRSQGTRRGRNRFLWMASSLRTVGRAPQRVCLCPVGTTCQTSAWKWRPALVSALWAPSFLRMAER